MARSAGGPKSSGTILVRCRRDLHAELLVIAEHNGWSLGLTIDRFLRGAIARLYADARAQRLRNRTGSTDAPRPDGTF